MEDCRRCSSQRDLACTTAVLECQFPEALWWRGREGNAVIVVLGKREERKKTGKETEAASRPLHLGVRETKLQSFQSI